MIAMKELLFFKKLKISGFLRTTEVSGTTGIACPTGVLQNLLMMNRGWPSEQASDPSAADYSPHSFSSSAIRSNLFLPTPWTQRHVNWQSKKTNWKLYWKRIIGLAECLLYTRPCVKNFKPVPLIQWSLPLVSIWIWNHIYRQYTCLSKP